MDKAASDISELRADVAELRHEMHVGFARLEQTIASTRSDLRGELKDDIAEVKTGIATMKSDLIMWSFVFWVGAVAAIALLAEALRP